MVSPGFTRYSRHNKSPELLVFEACCPEKADDERLVYVSISELAKRPHIAAQLGRGVSDCTFSALFEELQGGSITNSKMINIFIIFGYFPNLGSICSPEERTSKKVAEAKIWLQPVVAAVKVKSLALNWEPAATRHQVPMPKPSV